MKSFLITLSTMAAFSTVQAYNYPIGIPAAWTDPDVAQAPRPASWESEVAGHYYVDNNHPQATNTNNTYGYPAKPRLTFPTTYDAGSRVEVHGGPYTGGALIFNGTEEAPCWFIGVEHPILQSQIFLKGSYVVFDGFKFNASRKTVSMRSKDGSNLHHAMVRNCLMEGPGTWDGNTACIDIYGTAGNLFHDLIVYNNTIHDFGDDNYMVGGVYASNDYHGIQVSRDAYNVWVLENTVYNLGGDSIQFGTAYAIPVESIVNRIFVGKNVFHSNLENAIDVKQASDSVISQNECYDFIPTNGKSGVAIVIHNNPTGMWVIFNKVHSAGTGIISTGSSKTWFIGNVIYNIHHDPNASWNPESIYASGVAMHMRGADGGCIYNTLYDYDIGIQFPTCLSSYLVKGNIFANRAAGGGDDVNVTNVGVAALTTLDYNLYTDMAVKYAGHEYTLPSAMFTAAGQEAHGVENSNPHFTNSTGYDFSLGSDSPAVNAGPTVDASAFYADFQGRFGIDIHVDASGISRPKGTAWDIGSYEYAGAAAISPPGSLKVSPVQGK